MSTIPNLACFPEISFVGGVRETMLSHPEYVFIPLLVLTCLAVIFPFAANAYYSKRSFKEGS
jgi:hypothetical protein